MPWVWLVLGFTTATTTSNTQYKYGLNAGQKYRNPAYENIKFGPHTYIHTYSAKDWQSI